MARMELRYEQVSLCRPAKVVSAEKYSGTYVVNTLGQFAGQGNKIVSDKIGSEWFAYEGSNLTTTREFCEHLTKKRWIHISELPTILKGEIDGHECKINPATGLWVGAMEGTTVDNFIVNRGGWNCGHELMPVTEIMVPKEVRDRIKVGVKPVKAIKTEQKKEDIQRRWDERKTLLQENSKDSPHPAMKTDYPTASQVKDTIETINDEFASNKWFEHGVGDLLVETKSNNNGSTIRTNGKIWLTKERMDYVRSAMAKIGKSKSADITKNEADAMATYWHEITHNRNKTSFEPITKTERKFMELANEFIARKTLPEFYSKLGCAQTPYPEFMTNRSTTGYNSMVNNYDFIIGKLGLNAVKVIDSVKNQLYTGSYKKQSDGLYQGLIDGGLKKIDGSKLKKSEVNTLLKLCRDSDSTITIENWMKNNRFL